MTEKQSPLLYVEDEAIVSMVVTASLEDAGFVVEHVADGKSAVAALEGDPTRFLGLVTDVRLPHVDGWEIARRAREHNPEMPVVYVSGDSAADWAAKGVPNSIMIEKPFAEAQLVTALATLLNHVG